MAETEAGRGEARSGGEGDACGWAQARVGTCGINPFCSAAATP